MNLTTANNRSNNNL